jgi:hypothetical protein
VQGLVPSLINPNALPFDPADTGERNVTVTFVMDVATNTLGIQMIGRAPTSPQTTIEQIPYGAGLLPFDFSSEQELLQGPIIIEVSSTTIKSSVGDKVKAVKPTNGITTPVYLAYTVPSPENAYVQLSNSGYFKGSATQATRIINDEIYIVNIVNAPAYPKQWYTLDSSDRLQIYNNTIENSNEPLTLAYDYWATPNQPLKVQEYADLWNSNDAFPSKNSKEEVIDIIQSSVQWKNYSRFIMTIGVHDTRFDSNDPSSLHAIDSYFIDFDGFNAVIHKKAGNGQVLPSLDVLEQLPTDEINTINSNSQETGGVTFSSEVYNYNTAASQSAQMVPVPVQVNEITGNNDLIASIELPTSLLTSPRNQGGLNIPLVPPTNRSELPVVNAVDGTIDFTKNTPSNEVPSEIYEENLQIINEALQTQINTYYNNLNNLEKAFFDRFDYNLPYDDPNQTSTITVQNEDGSNTSIIRTAIPEDSVLMVLGRRRNALNKIYESLQATAELPNQNYEVVFSESNIEPTQAQIYTEASYESQVDSNYKVILYGMRPATAGPTLTSNSIITGTPIIGISEGKKYTITEISVANTGSLI